MPMCPGLEPVSLSMTATSGNLTLYAEQLAVSLGFATLASFLAMFASCRTVVAFFNRRSSVRPLENRFYRSFYRYHTLYWWVFAAILIVHGMGGLVHTKLVPTPADPEAFQHWLILGFALGSFLSVGIQFGSCRSFVGLVDLSTQKDPLRFPAYRGFYRAHSFLWLLVLAAAGGHIVISSVHTHVWPT